MLCFRPARPLLAAPLATLLAVGLTLGVAPSVRAQPADPPPQPSTDAGDPTPTSGPAADPTPPSDAGARSDPPGDSDSGGAPDDPALAGADPDDAAIDDDISIDETTSDDEDTSIDEAPLETANTLNLPDHLEPLPRAGWWSLFGAFTLGTTAGVLAGLAERQEDKALRLTLQLDTEAGQAPLYADEQDDYEQILRRGERLQTGAIVMGAFAGAAAVAGITLFVMDAKRRRSPETARRTQLRGSGIEVRF